ncbi:glycosyltransferase family 4 protein [Thiorhodococcus mannitoliphagus]|uniref:Glycosyltransferase family 4 protein n=1 Tax=Thiorhodococcus mannitoliphagus TaxID=329406 RepID=A0A6P1DSQ9_9GAMM|nr:glycosyltransferase family 4 protein [Thiorhodococcus mannitoliphagus]NEX18745.1 glycosyltransferase family 4 protein [Thiorhodococcus mannitoliphagus]
MNLDLVPLLLSPLLALVLSLAATPWLAAHPGSVLGRLDHPNARSLHKRPVPRTGGLGVLLGLLAAWLLIGLTGLAPPQLGWMIAAVALVAAVAFVDDLGHLPPWTRLLAHFGASAVLIAGGMRLETLELPGITLGLPGVFGISLTLLFSVWMTNLYNFMDGMDGFAGGMTAFGFGALAVLGWLGGDLAYAMAALCVATAAAGFLRVNFPPARIFLGDIGSSTLGLLAAGFTLWGADLGLFPPWAAVLAFSPFIVDATWTLLARLLRGERIWEAHRSHHYQRLVLAGWGHRKTLLRGYLVMAGAAGCALAAPGLPPNEQWMLLGAWAVIYAVIHYRVRLVERLARSGPTCIQ